MEAKFGIGDKVKVIKSDFITGFDGNIIDLHKQIIGKVGLIQDVTLTQGWYNYSVDGIPEKHAWYKEDQLEMINKNPNR